MGDPGRMDWRIDECAATATRAVVGPRPIRPETGGLDLVVMAACEAHLPAISAYLGEYADPLVTGVNEWRAMAEDWLHAMGGDTRLTTVERAV